MKPKTAIKRRLMNGLASEGFRRFQVRRARLLASIGMRPHGVHYFHEVSDPFSHLAVQRLGSLAEAASVPVVSHLVSATDDVYRGDATRFDGWALRDAGSVAACYGVRAPGASPSVDVTSALSALAPAASRAASGRTMDVCAFAEAATEIGERWWSGGALPEDGASGRALAAAGNALRRRLGHYQGAMFWFEGEWFWGLDRLALLEERLRASRGMHPGAPPIAPRPRTRVPEGLDAAALTLEVFPSLRSPYTAVGFPAIEALIERTRVTVRWRPVMPMMMRGVAAPRAKQIWILTDAAREARAAGAPFGDIVDPFGEPVKRAFALWSAVVDAGAEQRFLSRYLAAAWAEGVDITTDAGVDSVLADAGMDVRAVRAAADPERSNALLDANLKVMNDAGLWGVPSFRLLDCDGTELLACWGQDRIWRVGAEIVARAGGDPGIALPENTE